MTENAKYWSKRFDRIEQMANDKSVEYVAQLDKKYRNAQNAIQDKINAWYQRFADNNQITMSEARKWLSDSELDELKWTVDEYIAYGRENALDGKWIKQLENASAKAHINRLEALKIELQQQIEVVSGGMTDDVDKLIKSAYTDTYYRSCYEIERGTRVGFDVSKLDPSKVEKLVSKPWAVDGSDFSSRIWTNKTKLVGTLDQEISRMVLTGESPVKTIKRIAEAMNTSRANVARVVFTEQAYYTTLAQHDAYDNLEVEEYEVVCTLDNKTCDVCGSYDGKHYPTKDMEVGINAPPWHPNCRCTTCPYFDDIKGERAARDKDGNAITVPSDMTYEEWKEKCLKESVDNVNKKIYNKGGLSGAYNDENDPKGEKRLAHAKMYYETIRNSNIESIVEAISDNTKESMPDVEKAINHIFVDKHELLKGYDYFDESYDMAESIQRLREGKTIYEHDLILIHHEAYEYELMNTQGLSYEEAHKKAEEKYNYKQALDKFLKDKENAKVQISKRNRQ